MSLVSDFDNMSSILNQVDFPDGRNRYFSRYDCV